MGAIHNSEVKQDNKGIYIVSGGWIARPIDAKDSFIYTHETKYKVGDIVETKHFGGSPKHGVGIKDKANHVKGKHYEWEEYWMGDGLAHDYKEM
jgi:hypothetical protein